MLLLISVTNANAFLVSSENIVKSTSMNAPQIHVLTAVFALIWSMVLGVSVLEDTSMQDASAMLMNANLILVHMGEVVKMALTNLYVTVYRGMVGNSAKLISMNAHRIHANMEVSVEIISPHMYVNVYLDIQELIVNPTLMTAR